MSGISQIPDSNASITLNYDSSSRVKYKPPKSSSNKRKQKILAYSLLDKSLGKPLKLIKISC